jgi:hypothetical protein
MYKAIQIVNPMLIALALSGCGNATNTQHQNKDLVSTQWIVESFQDSAGRITDPGTITLSLRFFFPDSLAAKADNEIRGKYIIGKEATRDVPLVIYILFYTKRGLSPGSREIDFVEALENASAYYIDTNRLRIYYFGKSRVLNLIAQE